MKGDFSDQLDSPVMDEDADRPAKQYVPAEMLGRHAWRFVAWIVCAVAALAVILWTISCASALQPNTPCACAASEFHLVALVIAAGAIGGLIHAATSFVTFAGNRQLLYSWLWWLYLRAPIGVLLALLVYLAIRAEVFGDFNVADCADVYRIAFFAGLSGLFSKQVADKLSDVVDNLFVPSKRPTRADTLDHAKTADETKTAPADAAEEAKFNEIIRKIQQCLIKLGHLPARKSDGSPSTKASSTTLRETPSTDSSPPRALPPKSGWLPLVRRRIRTTGPSSSSRSRGWRNDDDEFREGACLDS